MKRSFIVTLDITGVTDADMKEYIRNAVGGWGGSFHPDDPLFGIGRENVEVKKFTSRMRSPDNTGQ